MHARVSRTSIWWLAAAIVSLITAVTVGGSLAGLRRQTAAHGDLHTIVVARRDLPVGAALRSSDLETRRIRGDNPADGALQTPSDGVGLIVRVPVLEGTPVTRGHITTASRGPTSSVVPENMRAVRVVTEHSIRPKPGDLIDVYVTLDPAELGPGIEPTITIAAAVFVLGTDRVDGSVGTTIMVSADQARRVAYAAARGFVSLAIAPPETAGNDARP